MKKLWNKYSYAIILIVLSFSSCFIILGNTSSSANNDYITITVNEGESLWELANEYASKHQLSAPEFIKWVEKENGISGENIYPGDSLVIPVVDNKIFTGEIASSVEE